MSRLCALLFFFTSFSAEMAHARETLTLLVGTTIESSGFLKPMKEAVRSDLGLDLKVIAMGTGRALATARRGDADAMIVHDPAAEEQFMSEGHGHSRDMIMVNDFVLVGPSQDPAGAGMATDMAGAFRAISSASHLFLSRGDDSGTHRAEREVWAEASVKVEKRAWYRDTGGGMGATLNTASGLQAYTLSDRASWIAFRNKTDMAVIFEAPDKLPNIYSYIVVNPKRHAHVNLSAAQRLKEWLLTERFKGLIEQFRPGGEPVFFSVRR